MNSTGTLLLCSGNGKFSKTIRKYNKILGDVLPAADLSHIAMIVESPEGLQSVTEATVINKWCDKRGVQTNLYSEWLEHYDGRVWERKIKYIPSSLFVTRMWMWIAYYKDFPYESGIPGIIELALAGVEWPWFHKRFPNLRTSSFHCSEYIARLCQMVELLGKDARPNKLRPSEWWGGGAFDSYLINNVYTQPRRVK